MKTAEYVRQRDNPGALINNDAQALANYKKQRLAMRNVKNLNERVDKIESTLDELKSLIIQALAKQDDRCR